MGRKRENQQARVNQGDQPVRSMTSSMFCCLKLKKGADRK